VRRSDKKTLIFGIEHAKAPQVHFLHMPHNVERMATSDADYYELGHQPPNRPWWQRIPLIPAIGAGASLLVVCTAATVWHNVQSSPTAASTDAAPSTSASGKGGSSTTARLLITNGCKKDPLWIANFAFQSPAFKQDLELAAGETHAFEIPPEGLASTRFWAKWGCDKATGTGCIIGESGGPGESCDPKMGCAPPVDSKFEATFGCTLSDVSKCATNPSSPNPAKPDPLGPIDWWDVSQVDGWTLPYKVVVRGDCPSAPKEIDCSNLSLDSCPDKEELGLKSGPTSLKLLDAQGSGAAVGCYSPCAKLTYQQWDQGHAFTPQSKEAQDFCCPTPPITPDACSSGPVSRTKFVEAVHSLCPGVYAYAYDDGMGLAQCPAGTVYDVTFYCPAGQE
jgi:hypothetical protein